MSDSNEIKHPTRAPLMPRLLRILGNIVVCGLIIVGAIGGIILINKTEPKAERVAATRKSSALVETVTVQRGTYSPRLVVLGTVQAAQDITLNPRVSGQVTEVSPSFVPGGMVSKDEVLLKIDPTDFANAVSIRQSELAQSEASLKIEEGRQNLAEQELALLEGTIESTNRALVLRQPQIASIRAEVSAKKAALERAKLDLERTDIVAPFDAQILTRSANVGSQVAPNAVLARLVGIKEYWIMATIPMRSLRWVQLPKNDGQDDAQTGSSVRLRNPDSWPEGAERTGRVSKMIGALDEQTRLARLLITVSDPLGKLSGEPPLILDTLVETEIEGLPIEDVVRLDRKLVRGGDTLWVMKDGQLEIREANIVFRDAEFAYIRAGLEDGDRVVKTTLATVADGIGLRELEATKSESEDQEATGP